jgi:hypothetical protein
LTEPVSPFFNHQPPPDANPHKNPGPHGGEVKGDDRFLADNMARERGIERRERDKRFDK